jgi:hypothetical protein
MLHHVLKFCPPDHMYSIQLRNKSIEYFKTKLLRCTGACCFLILPECEDLVYTLYFLNFHTNKIVKSLNHRNIETNGRHDYATIENVSRCF